MTKKTVLCVFASKLPKQFSRCFSLHKLPEQHRILQETIRNYAANKLKPIAAANDRQHRFPEQQIKDMAEMGLMSINVSGKWGGSGHDTLATAVAVEEISKACGGTGAIVAIHNCLYANVLDRLGTDKQNEQFLRPFTHSGAVGCFSLSEPDAGSDVSNISTTAIQDGDYYVLNGRKSWVTSGYEGKAAVVFATVDKKLKHKGITAFLLPLPTPGLNLGKKEDKLGIRASSTCDFILDNVKVPKENILGEIGNGFKIAMQQLDLARIGIASQALGIAQAALELSINHTKTKTAFGQPLNSLQLVKLRIANMSMQLEAARLLVWRAAVRHDEPGRSSKESSMAKLAASEAATFVTHNTIQLLGGMGYVSDTSAERHYIRESPAPAPPNKPHSHLTVSQRSPLARCLFSSTGVIFSHPLDNYGPVRLIPATD